MERNTMLKDEEILQIIKSFVLDRKYDMVALFLGNLDEQRKDSLMLFDEYCRAMIAFYLEKREFEKVYHIIENGHFINSEDLIEIWDQAHYREREENIHRPLNSLMRFRIRKKFPPPRNICPSGERPQHKLPERARETLKEWFSRHETNPYPSKQQREELCEETGLTDYQVKTWFSNARRKVKHRSHGGKTQMGDSKADQKMSLPMANKPQLYLRPNIAAAVDNEKWISDWSMTHPLQSLQEWQKKAFGSPITSPSCNYQEQSSPYDAKCWSSDEYQMQFFKDAGYPVSNAACVTEPCYYGDAFSQPLTFQLPVTNQFSRQSLQRDSYEANFRCQYCRNQIQHGDTEAALMLLDLQRPLITGEMPSNHMN